MPSPFPGMDPYLESWIWADCHSTLIAALRAQLNAKLPRRYVANTELYVWREDPSRQERLILGGPDVYAAEQQGGPAEGTPAATIVAPVTTVLTGVERKQRYLRIVDSVGRRIVTVIELLSPSNKTAHDSGEAYRFKRDEYIASGVNLVEIDLLRSGVRPPLGDPAPPVIDYYLLVSRTSERPRLGIWPFSVRDPLPRIPVPLDPGEPEVLLDLRAALDRAYEEGRYAEQLDYTKSPAPPLREPDATWAREFLAARSNP
jgi:hypothetical protein